MGVIKNPKDKTKKNGERILYKQNLEEKLQTILSILKGNRKKGEYRIVYYLKDTKDKDNKDNIGYICIHYTKYDFSYNIDTIEIDVDAPNNPGNPGEKIPGDYIGYIITLEPK